jgi:hypothetical protein
MSSQEYIRSVTDIEFPTLTPLPENGTTKGLSFLNITWQTWIIIILILTLLGINIFSYLAKGTQETASIIEQIFGPLLKLFGYTTLTTTKQTIETTATGTKAGVDIIADTTTGAIDKIQQTASTPSPTATSGTSTGVSTTSVPQGEIAQSSYPVQQRIQQAGANVDKWQQDSLAKALDNAKDTYQVQPDDSKSSIQTTGKSGWCYIGEEQGIRTCAEIGVNDACMSGDVFPNQAICMNPNLRA